VKRIFKIGVILGIVILTGCTSKTVDIEPLDTKTHHISEICIEKNPKVIVEDFLPYVRDEFQKHGINSKVYDSSAPKSCLYSLEYSANHHWDVVMYFKAAQLKIRHDNNVIASVRYESENGLNFGKFNSMEKKFTPIIDELLKGHTAPSDEEKLARQANKEAMDNPTVKIEETIEDKLVAIKKMQEDGLITEEEYAIKRQQLLSKY
jgi:hypothetical protein